MVRLVFRRLTHVRRTICTSVSLRASTRVSSGFTLRTLSSPSFGSHHVCSNSVVSGETPADAATRPHEGNEFRTDHFHCASGVFHSNTRKHNSLLGPCFKTGGMKPFRQHPEHQTRDDFRRTTQDSALRTSVEAKVPAAQVRRPHEDGVFFLSPG